MKLLSYKILDINEETGNMDIEFTFDTEVTKHTIHYAHSSHDEMQEIIDEKGEKKMVPFLQGHPLFNLNDAAQLDKQVHDYATAYINGKSIEQQEIESRKVSDNVKKLVGIDITTKGMNNVY